MNMLIGHLYGNHRHGTWRRVICIAGDVAFLGICDLLPATSSCAAVDALVRRFLGVCVRGVRGVIVGL